MDETIFVTYSPETCQACRSVFLSQLLDVFEVFIQSTESTVLLEETSSQPTKVAYLLINISGDFLIIYADITVFANCEAPIP